MQLLNKSRQALLLLCLMTVKEISQSTYPISIPTNSTYLEDSPGRKEVDKCRRNSDLPLFDLSTIAAATGNFSFGNKLGKGGFGFVYKVVTLNY